MSRIILCSAIAVVSAQQAEETKSKDTMGKDVDTETSDDKNLL